MKSKLEVVDTEVDAIRHFVGATLVQYRYPKKAFSILMGHEIDGKTPLNSDLTDDEITKMAMRKAVSFLKVIEPLKDGPCKDFTNKANSELDDMLKKNRF